MLVQGRMKTSTHPEAYCAEMNCDWQGEIPAVARCPKCNGRNIRRLDRTHLALVNVAQQVAWRYEAEQRDCSSHGPISHELGQAARAALRELRRGA